MARESESRVKVKLSLDRETLRLIRLEAFGRDCPLGQVVEDLVKASPRRFVLTDRLKGSQVQQGAEGARDLLDGGAQRPQGGPPALGVVSSAECA